MNDKKISKSIDIGTEKLSIEIGELAPRANSSLLASMGETVVLATVTVSKEDTDKDYFPLSVEFIEKFYAGGIISGSRFVKRERFPSEEAVLKARMIDRSLRPLFPANFKRDVQIVITVLSYDDVNDPVIVGINAASLAVCLSEIPFEGPIAGLKVGLKDGKYILNPSNGLLDESEMEFVVSGFDDKLIMIDGGAKEVDDKSISDSFDFASDNFKKLIKFQKDIIQEVKPNKFDVSEDEKGSELKDKLESEYGKDLDKIIYELKGNVPGEQRSVALQKIVSEVVEKNEGEYSKAEVSKYLEYLVKGRVRAGILEEEKRPSKRALDEIREIVSRTSVLPRTHGSSLFSRGITQSLSIVTLGSTRLEQIVESFEGEETKRFMHHYNGQSFSLGEAGRFNYYPGRREIGHGALAEKALLPVIPSEDDFPYTIRVVSEILSQQGSSSMAATCGSTLALMDAGVPIKHPVAGIAIGLVLSEDEKKYKLLTDIQDLEDFYGDMDFKVTGTKNGITAIQMDNKLKGVSISILKDALSAARKGLEFILGKIELEIKTPREKLSKYAPKITTLQVNQDKIADLIGPGGKVIKDIVEKTGAEIDIKQDGQVHVAAVSAEAKEKALKMINDITEEAEVGKIYDGVVSKVEAYGAFVDVSPSISGLVHVSEISDKYVSDTSLFLKEGDKVKVKVIGIDDQGRVNLSIKRVKKDKTE